MIDVYINICNLSIYYTLPALKTFIIHYQPYYTLPALKTMQRKPGCFTISSLYIYSTQILSVTSSITINTERGNQNIVKN